MTISDSAYPDMSGVDRYEPPSHDPYIQKIGDFFYCRICQWRWHVLDD